MPPEVSRLRGRREAHLDLNHCLRPRGPAHVSNPRPRRHREAIKDSPPIPLVNALVCAASHGSRCPHMRAWPWSGSAGSWLHCLVGFLTAQAGPDRTGVLQGKGNIGSAGGSLARLTRRYRGEPGLSASAPHHAELAVRQGGHGCRYHRREPNQGTCRANCGAEDSGTCPFLQRLLSLCLWLLLDSA
jgi:hypothetical protein